MSAGLSFANHGSRNKEPELPQPPLSNPAPHNTVTYIPRNNLNPSNTTSRPTAMSAASLAVGQRRGNAASAGR